MKRIISFVLMLTLVASLLVGCGSFRCDLCGQEKTGKKYTEDVYGTSITYCGDCKDALEELADMLS